MRGESDEKARIDSTKRSEAQDPPAYPNEIQDCQNVIDNFNRYSKESYGAFRKSVEKNRAFSHWTVRRLSALTGKHPTLYDDNGKFYDHDGYYCLTYESKRLFCRIWFTIRGSEDFSRSSNTKIIKSSASLQLERTAFTGGSSGPAQDGRIKINQVN